MVNKSTNGSFPLKGTGVMLLLMVAAISMPYPAGTVPSTVERVAVRSDSIVLGTVGRSDNNGLNVGGELFTRHAFHVEQWLKGSGPEQISLLTPGGFETAIVGGKERRVMTQIPGAVGVEQGERIVAFLSKIRTTSVRDADAQRTKAPFYTFRSWNGGKYGIGTNESGAEVVSFRFRDTRYMRDQASIDRIERMKKSPEYADLDRTAKLPRGKFIVEAVPVPQLGARLNEIIQGETP